MNRRTLLHALIPWLLAVTAWADSPETRYIFPPGGQRGTTVSARVGGLNLNSKAGFELLGPGVEGPAIIRKTETTWFEGPILPLNESQQAEDYPKDYAAEIKIAPDAALGLRACRAWTSQGATTALPFLVGAYPEIIEDEALDESTAEPVPLKTPFPVTINGRIFPREDIDAWSFPLKAGEVVTATVDAGRFGSALDPWVEAIGPDGRRLAEISAATGCDGRLAFLAPESGIYTVKIGDVNVKGSQAHIYRLTLTAGPSIETLFPLGGRRGETTRYSAEGLGLPSKTVSVAISSEGSGSGPRETVVSIPQFGSVVLEADDLAETTETEPNPRQVTPKALEIPFVGNGRIGEPGDVDVWRVALTKGKSYVADLRASRLGSRLDGLLRLTDAAGKELAKAEGTAARGGDPFLTITAPETGVYDLHVQDRFRSRGGSHWAYRLRVTEASAPAPDFRVTFTADALTIPRGGEAKWKIEAERIGGFSEPIALDFEGLPTGVTFSKKEIAANESAVELVFKADAKAKIQSARLKVRGTSKLKEKEIVRVADHRGPREILPIEDIRLAVALPTPFKIVGLTDFGWAPRGFVRHRRYKIERNGFKGPLEIQLADRQARHLQGVTGPILEVPATSDEFDYTVTLPTWMEIGRTSRSVVMATGVVVDGDGSEHEVNYSSPSADVQVIAVIGPGLMGLEASRSSLAIAPGRTIDIGVKVSKSKQVKGQVRVEMIPHPGMKGVSAEPLLLEPGSREGTLRIRCGENLSCPTEARLLLRANTMVGDDPAKAETSITIVHEATSDRPS